MVQYDVKLFHNVYREIGEELGTDTALAVYRMFKGTQVCFPVRLFNPEKTREMIAKENNGHNVKLLAKKYGYSEKTIRRIIKEKELQKRSNEQ
ncbi:MAG: Mor transcription activator family protein [Firmicutes bacterium]|nr:Mor transcription activator family protein [Bacillota bacterium]